MKIELTYREDTPRWIRLGAPVFSVLAALAVGAILILAVRANPLDVYYQMFIGPLTQISRLSEIAIKATAIILAGLAVYLPLKAGLWNIGAEGQIYVGGIAASWVALSFSGVAIVVLPVMAIVGIAAGGFWGLIPAYMRARWGANEIVTTLMMTFIAIQLNEWVIRGPLQGTPGFPSSEDFPDYAILPTIGDTNVHVGILFSLLAVVGVYLLMNRTKFGFEVTVTGSNPDAASKVGIETRTVLILTLVIGGALAGLGGMFQVAGAQGRLQSGLSPGYGFTAIPVALLGRNGAFRLLAAALLFSFLFVGGNVISTRVGLPSTIIDVIEALIILFIIMAEFFKRFRVDIEIPLLQRTEAV